MVMSAGFIRSKQTKIWACESRALHLLHMKGKNGLHSRTTQLSLSHILPVVQSQQGEIAGIGEYWVSGSPVKERYQPDLWGGKIVMSP